VVVVVDPVVRSDALACIRLAGLGACALEGLVGVGHVFRLAGFCLVVFVLVVFGLVVFVLV
jgi:hypothetical protein